MQPLRILRAVVDRPVVVGAAARGEQLGVAELAPEHLPRDGRIDHLHVDALLVHVLQAALGAEAVLLARSKRSIALATALKNAGAAIGYLPFSRVNGSPSTRKVRRPDSARDAHLRRRDLVALLDILLQHPVGFHHVASTSTILYPSFIVVPLDSQV